MMEQADPNVITDGDRLLDLCLARVRQNETVSNRIKDAQVPTEHTAGTNAHLGSCHDARVGTNDRASPYREKAPWAYIQKTPVSDDYATACHEPPTSLMVDYNVAPDSYEIGIELVPARQTSDGLRMIHRR